LKQNLKNKRQIFTLDLIKRTTADSAAAPTSILQEDGSINSNKFADSILQSSLSVYRLFGDEPWDSPKNLRELNAKYLTDKAPILKSGATYLDYFNWIDPMLDNLKKHPDFRYEFLLFQKPTTSSEPNQKRLDDIYDLIMDKIEYSISKNQKLQTYLCYYTSTRDIYPWWYNLQYYFLPGTEIARQQRETHYLDLTQLRDETSKEFIQRT